MPSAFEALPDRAGVAHPAIVETGTTARTGDWVMNSGTGSFLRTGSPTACRASRSPVLIADPPEEEAIVRKFSVRPTLTVRGRKFKGLRGWAGKPTHPPLTDFPIAAYIFAAIFDIISSFGRHDAWARDFFHAGTYVFIAGAVVSVFAALHGVLGLAALERKGTQARRTGATRTWTMITVDRARAGRHRVLRLNVRTRYYIRSVRDPRALDRGRRARRRSVSHVARRHARVRLRLQRRDQ